jgi:hypothetical protein
MEGKMKKVLTGCMALAVAIMLTATTSGQNFQITSGGLAGGLGGCATGCDSDGCDTGGCDDCGGNPCGCDQSAWIFDSEIMFFRYHRADGVNTNVYNYGNGYGDGYGDEAEFGFDVSPRLTLGYMSPDGLGVRVRWWEYNHSADSAYDHGYPSQISVDTYTVDIEFYEELSVGCYSTLEISGGIRYNEFEEQIIGNWSDQGSIATTNRFSGFGGLIGAELNRSLAIGGSVYARARLAILMDDKKVILAGESVPVQSTLLDSTQGMTEIGFGYEYSRCLCGGSILTARVGAEWQNWFNYSSTSINGTYGGPSDVGFGGFLVGVGLEY